MFTPKIMYLASKPIVLAYSRAMLKMDIEMQERFPKGAKIIAANHPSTTDPFFVAGMVREQSYILIKDVLFRVPLLGEYLKLSGHLPVEAGNGQAIIEAAVDLLRSGKNVIIFPEGDLSPLEGGFLKARTGVARLALMSGAPVVPVGIHLERNRVHTIRSTVRGQVEYGRWYLRGPYNLTVGSPLHFHGSVEDRPHVRAVAENVMHHIIEMARLSEIRMNRTFTPLTTLPDPL